MLAAFAALAGAVPAAAAPNPGGSYPDDPWLALHFRPLLLFDSQERWRPLDVDRFLGEPGHQACPPLGAGACMPFSSVAQLTPAVAYLDLRGVRHDGADATAPDLAGCPKSLPILRDCDLRARSKIYAHVVREPDPAAKVPPRRIAIDYWWFLRYNAYSIDQHEGDWEGVTVIVDPFGKRVLEVHYAAHADVWRYDRGVPQIVGRHVEVFVARGDHASYPRACRRLCRQSGGTLPEARFDGRRAWVGNTASGCRSSCVRLMPAGPDGRTPASWDAWDGRWGAPYAPAFPPPRTPAFQGRFRRPFAARRSHRHLFQIL
jgi:hypothetical protein